MNDIQMHNIIIIYTFTPLLCRHVVTLKINIIGHIYLQRTVDVVIIVIITNIVIVVIIINNGSIIINVVAVVAITPCGTMRDTHSTLSGLISTPLKAA
jgi:hypothetical protein